MKDGSQVAPRRPIESPADAPYVLHSLAVAGLQAAGPTMRIRTMGSPLGKLTAWLEPGTGQRARPEGVWPAPDQFPLRLIAAADLISDLLSDPIPESDSARFIPSTRPSSADGKQWEESLRDFGARLTVDRDGVKNANEPQAGWEIPPTKNNGRRERHEFVAVFDTDWLGAESCTFPKAPASLVTGRPDEVRVPKVDPDGSIKWPDSFGEVSEWVALTLSQIEALAARGIEYRMQYVTARKVIASTGDQMSKEHKKMWSKIRFLARGQIEPTIAALLRGIEEYRATIADRRVLVAEYQKARNEVAIERDA